MKSQLTETQKEGLRESVYLASRLSFLCFATAALLAGWLVEEFRSEERDIFTWTGLGLSVFFIVAGGWLLGMAVRYIVQMRKPK